VHRTEIECTHTPDNIIVGCGMCHNHKKWPAEGMPLTREEAYRIIGAPVEEGKKENENLPLVWK